MSPPIQWKELLSQKNMEICKTTPSIMATALTKSNPWSVPDYSWWNLNELEI